MNRKGNLRGNTLLYISYIIFIIVIFLLVSEIMTLKNELALRDTELEKCKRNIDEYKRYTSSLEEKIISLNESLNNLSSRYRELEEYISSTIKELRLYEEEINEALVWFKENANLQNSGLSEYQMNLLVKRCLKVEDDYCEINLGCIYLLNDEVYGFHYKYDNQTTNKSENLLSLREFVEKGGGDCEDYAFFYKAEFNYLKNYCFNKGIKNILLRTYSSQKFPESKEQESNFFLDNAKTWYVPDVYENIFYNYNHIFVVCGNMEDTEGKSGGHCVVALAQETITTPYDLENENAILIEPQTGAYLGKIGREIALYRHGTWEELKDKKGLYYIISDEDQYLYLFTLEKWTSYKEFKEKIEDAFRRYRELYFE